ncbi:bifunctional polynucleotide phosphatase/kinase-like [Dreissena polymorpha]|uniref:bifunctional polynucleotide phosphatase/kinase-like n=1 Tax=Dreissena polymorpha TaxID=45954 RepID=UPI002264C459|nr:bifunctional polynucleotide phosphatase/kinase-like [Dreissena polymorpha]XP_052286950.1 bifunctional polynucleotide phosphatase/kinase-like [Dreissena polymorpha]XP_052286959.1 bifunctional polynucleotide phosphatase/kinase-like [Dreissena polymorpha]XP_052286970.1 bifunctional polynucleotide phosphatase/kinase-like [Dreissena polymorpha]
MESNYKWSMTVVCPNGNHDPIKLRHMEAAFLGRSPMTRIVDPRCSRKQVQLIANLETGDVEAIQLGENSSALDGIEMIKNKVYKMNSKSVLQVLTGFFPQKLVIVRNENKQDREKHKSDSEMYNADKRHRSSHKDKQRRSDSESSKTELSKKRSHSQDGSEVPFKKPKLESDSKTGNVDKEEKVNRKRSQSHDGYKVPFKKPHHESDSKKANDKDKESNKKRSHSHDVNEVSFKKPNLESDSTKGIDKDKEVNKKRSHSHDGNEVPFKKPKLENESKKGNINNDEDHLKDVSSKLALLKSNVKNNTSKESSVTENKETKGEQKHSSGSSPKSVTESRWEQIDSLYVYTTKDLQDRKKVAAFDIDGTIITTKSGKVFATNADDWRLLYRTETLKKLAYLHDSGFKIVFFTNQMGVSKGKTNIEELKTKFIKVVKEVGVPVQILVATKGGLNRKPCTGMWTHLTKHLNSGLDVDLSQSFYVGDAAGRPKGWMPKMKKDFSSSDRLFALNVGLQFFTPEEYFLGYPTNKFNMPEFDPRMLNPSSDLLDPKSAAVTTPGRELIVLVGSPASGKSFFAKEYMESKGYIVVNRDILKSWQKCVAACTDGLKKGQSVVVDNTNPDVESRKRYIVAAKTNGVPCRCFVFTTTIQHARHNERFREITDKTHQPINDMILNSYKGKYHEPTLSEGLKEIVKVNFVPKFKDKKMEILYRNFLLEK